MLDLDDVDEDGTSSEALRVVWHDLDYGGTLGNILLNITGYGSGDEEYLYLSLDGHFGILFRSTGVVPDLDASYNEAVRRMKRNKSQEG